jgi:hypothetical protein
MMARAIPARRVGAFVAATVLARPECALFTVTAPRRPIFALAGKAALGELLLGPPRCAGTALATRRTVTPAAGIVVFIVVAGHEGSHFGCKWQSCALFHRGAFSRKIGIHVC